MDLQLNINKREKLSDQLYRQLLSKIISGELKEGDKLPSENEVAKAFKVSRPVIREAQLRLQADFDFHIAIAEATGNEFYVSILNSLHTAMRSGMRVAMKITRSGTQERLKKVVEEHPAILDAIATGDMVAADLAMRYHIHSAHTRLTNHLRDI